MGGGHCRPWKAVFALMADVGYWTAEGGGRTVDGEPWKCWTVDGLNCVPWTKEVEPWMAGGGRSTVEGTVDRGRKTTEGGRRTVDGGKLDDVQ